MSGIDNAEAQRAEVERLAMGVLYTRLVTGSRRGEATKLYIDEVGADLLAKAIVASDWYRDLRTAHDTDAESKVWPDDYGWGDLMTLLDAHWPADVFGGTGQPLDDLRDDVQRDIGVRIVALLRWVDHLHTAHDTVLAQLAEAWDDGARTAGGYGHEDLWTHDGNPFLHNPYREGATHD